MKYFWRVVLLAISISALAACGPLPWATSQRMVSNTPVFAQNAAAYDSVDLDWYDSARERAIPVRLYLPKSAAAAVPLVVFSHGLGGSRNGYSYLADEWASQGIASLHLQHIGSDRSVWQGSRWDVLWKLQDAAGAEEAMARALDLRFALDQLLASPYAAKIDAKRIVAGGHSYGANTAMLAAGAQVEYAGKALNLRDSRVKGLVLISSPPFYGEEDFAPILQGISVPSLHVTSTGDVIEVPGYHSAATDRIKVFEAMGGSRKTLVVFKDGSHSMFTDRGNTGGAALNPLVKRATSELTRLYLQDLFGVRLAADALTKWQARNADILASVRALAPATLAAQQPSQFVPR